LVLVLASACGGNGGDTDKDTGGQQADTTGREGDVVAQDQVPGADVPASEDVPETPEDVPETPEDVPETPEDVPETPEDVPETPEDGVADLAEEVEPQEEVVAQVTAFVINEFVVTPTDEEAVEVYNGTEAPVSVSGWTLHVLTNDEKTWTLPDEEVAAGGFLVLKADNLTAVDGDGALLPNAGASLWLTDGEGTEVDKVLYGTDGPVPGPIYATSTARVTDGLDTGDGAADFNWDPTPTVGAPNDVPGVALGSVPLYFSEIFMDKDDDDADFVEALLGGDANLDVTGWTFVVSGAGKGDDFLIEDALIMEPGFWWLPEADFPEYAKLDARGFLYLFDADGKRVFQMGWTDLPEDGATSLGHLDPAAANAPADCYNTETCGLVPLMPTMGETNQAAQ